jgi:hypothetical protein
MFGGRGATDGHNADAGAATAPKHRIRGNGEVIKREEFEQRKEAAEQARQARLNKKPKKLASQGKSVEDYPLLQVRIAARLGVACATSCARKWIKGGAAQHNASRL